MAATGGFIAFTKQAQGAERGWGEAKAVSQRVLEGAARLLFATGVGNQPFKAGGGELAKGELVGRFGPDEFGDEQSQAHEGWV